MVSLALLIFIYKIFAKKSGSMLVLVFCLGEIKNKGTMIIDEEGELDKSIRQSQLVEETID